MVDPADLMRFYRHNFEILKLKMMSLAELEDMLPFERFAYITLIEEWSKDVEKNKSKK